MRQNFTPGEQDLWVVGANGANPVDLTNSPGVEETAPEFSSDGTKIVYISTGPTPCCTTEYNNDIWVMNANGTGQTQLTHTDFPTQNTAPAWSPDGTKIAYESGNGGFLSIMNADGTESTPLVTNSGAKYPSWVPVATAAGATESPPAAGGGVLPAPVPTPTKPKALTCKKGFKKKVIKGKPKCVKKHKARKHKPKH
jgi:hypothetical protein